jgi:hypothetical protein
VSSAALARGRLSRIGRRRGSPQGVPRTPGDGHAPMPSACPAATSPSALPATESPSRKRCRDRPERIAARLHSGCGPPSVRPLLASLRTRSSSALSSIDDRGYSDRRDPTAPRDPS